MLVFRSVVQELHSGVVSLLSLFLISCSVDVVVDEVESWRLFMEVLVGIQHIHSQGLIHRDLKVRGGHFLSCDVFVCLYFSSLATWPFTPV